MFSERPLDGEVATVRDREAPDAIVLDADRDFETLDPAVAEDLLLLTDSVDPLSYPAEWVPADAPEPLQRLASSTFTVGMPGDGGVAWTGSADHGKGEPAASGEVRPARHGQTDPPVVLVKPRLEGSPEDFVEFLIAEALVEVGLGLPEHFLGFFGERYPDLADAVDGRLDPASTYQLAAALFDAYVGLHTRDVFADWKGDLDGLHAAWADAGKRLQPRLSGLSEEVTTGQTDFAAAAELACSALKHDREPPTPFGALDTAAYREHGAEYAVTWAAKTVESLDSR
jgi:hypothetical protein